MHTKFIRKLERKYFLGRAVSVKMGGLKWYGALNNWLYFGFIWLRIDGIGGFCCCEYGSECVDSTKFFHHKNQYKFSRWQICRIADNFRILNLQFWLYIGRSSDVTQAYNATFIPLHSPLFFLPVIWIVFPPSRFVVQGTMTGRFVFVFLTRTLLPRNVVTTNFRK
jgi:hypothetical protein